jgi:hypothetical protein
MFCGLRSDGSASWRDGRGLDGLVQRGTRKRCCGGFPLTLAMSGERGVVVQMSNGIEDG